MPTRRGISSNCGTPSEPRAEWVLAAAEANGSAARAIHEECEHI